MRFFYEFPSYPVHDEDIDIRPHEHICHFRIDRKPTQPADLAPKGIKRKQEEESIRHGTDEHHFNKHLKLNDKTAFKFFSAHDDYMDLELDENMDLQTNTLGLNK